MFILGFNSIIDLMVGLTSDFLEKMLGIPADFAAMIIGTAIIIAIIILRTQENVEKLNKKKKNKKG